jgi:diphthamide synthase (EF-2-diphthine--ammonia ligase)
LEKTEGSSGDVDVLFWSGGKDSYLSLLLLEQQVRVVVRVRIG